MTTLSPRITEHYGLSERPVIFLDSSYYQSLAEHAEKGGLANKFLTRHLGSTVMGRLVDRIAPVELATRFNALTPLTLAYSARNWRATQKRLQLEREYKSSWAEFQNNFTELARSKPNFRLLQIGAHDGITNDRLYPLLMGHPDWHAILVEPMPEAFIRLKKNYSKRPNTQFVNRAVGDMDGSTEMYHIVSNKGAPLFIDLTATSDPRTLELFRDAGGELATTVVEGTTLSKLLEDVEFEGQDIDLMFVDAEGCDYAILQQLLLSDGSGLPRFIVAEHDHMSDEQYYGTITDLQDVGYKTRCIAHDILAEKN
jgi:FkbM family methyltransferase